MQKDKNIGGKLMTENMEGTPLVSADYSVSLPPIVTDTDSFHSRGEEALVQRYSRQPKLREDLVFEFTRDPALLHQYYRIYEKECRVITHIPGFREAEKEYNRKGHIVVARIGNLCIGGARLSVRTPRQTKPLPMEMNGFNLHKHFPQLEQKQMRYGELSRLVLLPEFRDGDIARRMFVHLYRKAAALGLDIGFAAAPLLNIRAYRLSFMALGLRESDIHFDIEVPPYPGFEEVKDYLLSLVVDKSLVKDEDLAAYKQDKVSFKEEV